MIIPLSDFEAPPQYYVFGGLVFQELTEGLGRTQKGAIRHNEMVTELMERFSIPFAVLICIYGAHFLIKRKERVFKALFIFLLALSLIEFLAFINDYFGDYRKRSYPAFNYNIGAVLESAIKSTKIRNVERVYLDNQISFIDYYSAFYQRKLGTDISDKQLLFNPLTHDFLYFPKNSLVVVRANHIPQTKGKVIGGFERIEVVREPEGNESFYIFYRDK